MTDQVLLKKDLFGEIRLSSGGDHMLIVRDVSAARAWLSWLARYLMRREARVLAALTDIDGIPELQSLTHDRLTRSYIAGTPMQRSRPTDRGYFLESTTTSPRSPICLFRKTGRRHLSTFSSPGTRSAAAPCFGRFATRTSGICSSINAATARRR
jgi:hypothetical protein